VSAPDALIAGRRRTPRTSTERWAVLKRLFVAKPLGREVDLRPHCSGNSGILGADLAKRDTRKAALLARRHARPTAKRSRDAVEKFVADRALMSPGVAGEEKKSAASLIRSWSCVVAALPARRDPPQNSASSLWPRCSGYTCNCQNDDRFLHDASQMLDRIRACSGAGGRRSHFIRRSPPA